MPNHILDVKAIKRNKKRMSFTTATLNLSGLIQAEGKHFPLSGHPDLKPPYRWICPEMFGPCTDTSTPAHDNTCDCTITHRPICQPSHFQAPDRWCRHVCLGAHQRITACLPSSDSAANLTCTAFKVIYGPVVGSTGSLHCGSIPCEWLHEIFLCSPQGKNPVCDIDVYEVWIKEVV